MKKRVLPGIILGTLFGVSVAWIAMSTALPEGGLAALAAVVVGALGGLGIGGLIGILATEGALDEAEEEVPQALEQPVVATSRP